MRYLLGLVLLLFFISCEKKESMKKNSLYQLKRIEELIEKNRNNLLNNSNEKKLLRNELNCLNGKADTTSLYCLYLLSKSAISNYNDDVELYLKSFYSSCKKTNDPLNYARYYRLKGLFHFINEERDLVVKNYLNSEKLYKKVNKINELSEINLMIAFFLLSTNDFTGSEMYITKLKYFENNILLKIKILEAKIMILSQSKNHSFKLDEVESEAAELLREINLKIHERLYIKSILGKIYNLKKEYRKSYRLLNEVLSSSVFENYYYVETFNLSMINLLNIENLKLRTNLKIDYEKLIEKVQKSKILSNESLVYLDYANYLYRIQDYPKSLKYARKAHLTSKKAMSKYNELNSLLLLAKLDNVNAVNYFIVYDKKIDELINYQRMQKDNFYKIQLETNLIAQAKEKVENQRNQVLWAICILLVISALLFIIYRNRLMNSKIEFQKKHQKSSELIQDLIVQNQAIEVEARQNEQRRIAMEIHDNVLNQLASVRYKLFKLNFSQDAKAVIDALQGVENIRQVEVELRNLTHNLTHQSQNDNVSIHQMIHQLITVHEEIYNQKIKLNIDDWNWEGLSSEVKLCFVRIIQEALFNCAKHAKAQNIEIDFNYTKDSLTVQIKDDGKGFNIDGNYSGIGLQNLAIRAAQIQAMLHIQSEKKQGTVIKIEKKII